MSKKRQQSQRSDQFDESLVTTAAVSVTKMAAMVGMSRERFYQLLRSGIFPPAQKSETTVRPYYSESQQRECLKVRRTGVGMNGQPVMFNRRLSREPKQNATEGVARPAEAVPKPQASELVRDGVQALGLDVNTEEVEAAIKACFPEGVGATESGKVVAAVFRHLYRQRKQQ